MKIMLEFAILCAKIDEL